MAQNDWAQEQGTFLSMGRGYARPLVREWPLGTAHTRYLTQAERPHPETQDEETGCRDGRKRPPNMGLEQRRPEERAQFSHISESLGKMHVVLRAESM